MSYLYGRSWNEELRKPVAELTEAQAKETWESGPQLGVAAGPELAAGDVPVYVLEMTALAEDITRLSYDAAGSVVASISYETVDGRLFLYDATEWLYDDADSYHRMDQAKATRTFYYRPDGYARLRTTLRDVDGVTVEEFTDIDVSKHWVEPVTWGDWDRIGTYQP